MIDPHPPDGDDPDLDTEVPEGDAAEQAAPAVPDGEDPETGPLQGAAHSDEANPADTWEQSVSVAGDGDEECEHDDRDR